MRCGRDPDDFALSREAIVKARVAAEPQVAMPNERLVFELRSKLLQSFHVQLTGPEHVGLVFSINFYCENVFAKI